MKGGAQEGNEEADSAGGNLDWKCKEA